MNFILFCTWLTYTDYNYSTGVGDLKRNMRSAFVKPDSHETICQLYCDDGISNSHS